MSRNKFQYNTEDVLRSIEAESRWLYESASCSSCRNVSQEKICNTPQGRICADCAYKIFQEGLSATDISRWNDVRILRALSDSGRLRDRFLVLWNHSDCLSKIKALGEDKLSEFQNLLVENLGFITEHPLSLNVRQLALNNVIAMGVPILPKLLKNLQPNPWQFYINLLSAMGTIAPQNQTVQENIEKAASHSNPVVRKMVLDIISDHPTDWAEKILDKLKRDADPKVRTYVPRVTSIWKYKRRENKPKVQNPAQEQLFYEDADLKRKLMPEDLEPFEKIVYNTYGHEELKKIYLTFLTELYPVEKFDLPGHLNTKQLSKCYYARALAAIYAEKTMFEQFWNEISAKAQEVFSLLVWNGERQDVRELEKKMDVQIIKPGFNIGRIADDLNDDFLIFQAERTYRYRAQSGRNVYDYQLYVDAHFRRIFKGYLPKPREADFQPLHEVENSKYLYENKDRIVQKIFLYLNYIQQGNLAYNKTGEKLLKTSITQMQKFCEVDEFYEGHPDKALHTIRINLLINFLLSSRKNQKFTDPVKFLKNLFREFFLKQPVSQFSFFDTFTHINGYYYQNIENEIKARQSLLKILESLPVSEWISVENILEYAKYHEIEIDLCRKQWAYNEMYYQKSLDDSYYKYRNRISINADNFSATVRIPFLKLALFLFGSFGILDLIYDDPENPIMEGDLSQNYLTIYDGLQAVRLTPLGEYLIGRKTSYEIEIEDTESRIILDDKRLLITLQGNDVLKRLAISKIGEKVSESCFRVNNNSFLLGCSSKRDILNKIELFKSEISDDPPLLWKEFLDGILNKIDPIIHESDLMVFKLKPNNELFSLLAQDEILKKLVLKAEGYRIVLNQKDLKKVKKRLTDFGYLVDEM